MGAKPLVRNRVCNHKKSSYGFSQILLRVGRERRLKKPSSERVNNNRTRKSDNY
jgi:hypothetical protein